VLASAWTMKDNETLQHHVTEPTSSQAPPTGLTVTSGVSSSADGVIAALRHYIVPLHYDDVNIPSDSYFTGDEEIPVWNVPDHVPLLHTSGADDKEILQHHVTQTTTSSKPTTGLPVTSQAPPRESSPVTTRADDVIVALRHQDYDDVSIPSGSYFTGDEEIPIWNVPNYVPLLDAGAAPSAPVNDGDDNGENYDEDDNKRTALYQLLAHLFTHQTNDSSAAGAEDDGDVTSPHKLVTSSVRDVTSLTDDPASSHMDSLTTTRLQAYVPLSTTPSSRSQSTPRMSTGRTQSTSSSDQSHVVEDQRDVTTVTSATVQFSANHSSPAAKTVQRQSQTARRSSRPSSRRVGGFGVRDEGHTFDFFDYIVDYQTPRPPRRRVRPKTRRQRKKIKRGRSRSPDAISSRSTGERSDGVFDHLDAVGQSYNAEITDAGSGTSGQSLRRRGGSERRRLPQSVHAWVARSQPPHNQRKSVKIRGSSAVHLAATVNKNLGLGRPRAKFFKEGKEMESAAGSVEPVSTVDDNTVLHRVFYRRPTSPHQPRHHSSLRSRVTRDPRRAGAAPRSFRRRRRKPIGAPPTTKMARR